MGNRFLSRLLSALALLVVLASPAFAQRQQYGPKTNYSASEVAASINKTSLNPSLKQYANDIGGLARFESGGNTGIYNGSCCTGILQVNRSNLMAYGGGITPQQYANMSLDQQTEIWARVTNAGANSAAVKKLMSMKEFDGQPVDGALVLSCIQLGVGNCQKMLNSGSCSGFKDSNGTTICKMANKMRQNMGKETFPEKPGDPSDPKVQPTTNPPVKENMSEDPLTGNAKDPMLNISLTDPGLKPQSFTPQDQGPAGTMTKIGDPTVCWVCDAVTRALGVTEKVSQSSMTVIGNKVLPLALTLALVSLMYMFARALASGSSPFGKTMALFFVRLVVVASIFSASGLIREITDELFISAPIELGAEVGTSMGTHVTQALGYNPQEVGCTKSEVGEMGVTRLVAAGEALVKVACAVHVGASTGILMGGIVATHPTKTSTFAEKAIGMILLAVGLAMMTMAFLALVNFGFAMVEAVIVTGVVAVFLPLMLVLYIFDSTKDMIRNAFSNMLFVFLNLAFAAVGAAVMVFLMSTAMSMGLGESGRYMSAQEIATSFSNLVTTQDVTVGEGLKKLTRFCTFMIAGFLLASRVLQATNSIAAEASGFALGQAGAMARAGSAAFTRLVSTSIMAGGAGAAIGGRVVGAAAGKAVGGFMGAAGGAGPGPAAGTMAAAKAAFLGR